MHAQLTAARQEGEAVQRRAAAAERAELAQQHHQELHAAQQSHEQVHFMHPHVCLAGTTSRLQTAGACSGASQ